MKGSVLRKLKNERLQEMYDQYVAGLKGDVAVEVDQQKLDSIEIESSARPGIRPGATLDDGHGHGAMPGGEGGRLQLPGDPDDMGMDEEDEGE